jgi:hypothetical protein
MQDDQGTAADGAVERRTALRRGAAVLAGVAGIGIAGAVNGSAANAGAGDNLVLGQANDAGVAATSVNSNTADTTLELSNSGGSAPLRVAIGTASVPDTSQAGDVFSLDGIQDGTVGIPVYTHISGDDQFFPLAALIFTDQVANQPIPVIPTRVLDTRNANGRRQLINVPAGTLDSAGRVIGGRSVTLSLNEQVASFGGVYANVVSTGSTAGGFLQIYPAEPRPGASTVNFAAGQTIANFSLTGLNFDDANGFTVKLFASVTSHVIVDVTAFAVGSPAFINPDIQAVATRATPAQRAALSRRLEKVRPEWAKAALHRAGLR